ncbi:MAG: hypothetical protein KDA55_20430, partial [Planctomycetales bacterium]|nr:hypothetical protein [Planctomycetales bacterium]
MASVFDGVTQFSRNASTGQLTFVARHTSVELSGVRSVAEVPGRDLWVVATVFNDRIRLASRDPLTGTLTLLDTESDGVNGVDGLDGADHVSVSPDGRNVYATGQLEH